MDQIKYEAAVAASRKITEAAHAIQALQIFKANRSPAPKITVSLGTEYNSDRSVFSLTGSVAFDFADEMISIQRKILSDNQTIFNQL